MEKLIALVDIRYKGKLYIPGEEISDHDPEMAEAWKRAGSVKVLGGADKVIPEERNGTESGGGSSEVDEGEGKMADENSSENQSKEEPDKEPPKEGKKRK